AAQNPQSAVQNPQSAIQNPQSAIRNPKSAIQNPQSAIQNPQSAIQNPQSAIRNPQSVDSLCAQLFFTHTAQESDDNLSFVRNRLLKREADLASLLDLYRKVRAGKRVPDDETNPLCGIVKLSGVAREEGGLLSVRNRIYDRVFDRGWVNSHMPNAELQRQRAAYRRGVL